MKAHLPTTNCKRLPGVRLALASMLAAATLIGLATTPSAADDQGDDIWPLAELDLTLGRTDGIGIPPDVVTLVCYPADAIQDDGGTHPDPEAACDSLRAVDGDFTQLPTRTDIACTEELDPHTARATGRWEGDLVDWEKTFSNRCFAGVETDLVYAF